jgi:hypothetical protein
MAITSLDNFGHGNTPVSMSELRTYFGGTNPISLNGSFNGGIASVPDTLPASGAETSFSDFRSQNRILKKKGTTQVVTSGTSWTPAQSNCVQYNVYVLGGGGSGGGCSTSSGREKVSSGGAAGGVAFRRYSAQDDGITSASISIGSGGAGISYPSSSDYKITGRNGGTTTFNPDGTGTTISATGGSRGFASQLGTSAGEAAGSPLTAGYGYCAASSGGTGSGGESNYTGGYGGGFNISNDAAAVSGGGSPNLGSGGANGISISTIGQASTGTTAAPTKPSEWGSDVTATFQGGSGVQDSDASAGASDGGTNYGAGSGGSSSEDGAGSTGNGSQGAIFVTYYELNS